MTRQFCSVRSLNGQCAHRQTVQCCPLVELSAQRNRNHARCASRSSGVYILIAVGALMMLVGFLGCYGAIQESQCLLGTVSILSIIRLDASNHVFFLQRDSCEDFMFVLICKILQVIAESS